MNKNELYELTRLIGNSGGLENDFSQIMQLFKETLEKKYVSKLHAAAKSQELAVIESPSREVNLMRAVQAFTNENGHSQMDKMIEQLQLINAIKNINESVSSLSQNREQMLQAMSADGKAPLIEADFPENSPQLTGLLLTLAMAKII